MTVGEVMSSPPVKIHPDASLLDLAQLMIDRRIGDVPVVGAGAT